MHIYPSLVILLKFKNIRGPLHWVESGTNLLYHADWKLPFILHLKQDTTGVCCQPLFWSQSLPLSRFLSTWCNDFIAPAPSICRFSIMWMVPFNDETLGLEAWSHLLFFKIEEYTFQTDHTWRRTGPRPSLCNMYVQGCDR